MRRRIFSVSALSLFLSLSFISCDEEKKEEAIETDPITFTKEGEAYLIKSSGDTIKKLNIELAETNYEQQTGLMYRESMEDDQAMLFIYDSERIRNFYMKNTNISLDIIYYDADSTLVSIQKNTTPRDESSLPSEGPAQYILEVNAGLSDEWGLEKDDKISFRRTE